MTSQGNDDLNATKYLELKSVIDSNSSSLVKEKTVEQQQEPELNICEEEKVGKYMQVFKRNTL